MFNNLNAVLFEFIKRVFVLIDVDLQVGKGVQQLRFGQESPLAAFANQIGNRLGCDDRFRGAGSANEWFFFATLRFRSFRAMSFFDVGRLPGLTAFFGIMKILR